MDTCGRTTKRRPRVSIQSEMTRLLGVLFLSVAAAAPQASPQRPATRPETIRLAGTIEAARARTVLVPRLAGQNTPTLTITQLVNAVRSVKSGDPLFELDRLD